MSAYEKIISAPIFRDLDKIKRLIGSHAYELEFPPNVGKHPVFHISMLEPYNVNPIPGKRSPTPPPELDLDGEATWEVEEVLSSRTRYRKVQYFTLNSITLPSTAPYIRL